MTALNTPIECYTRMSKAHRLTTQFDSLHQNREDRYDITQYNKGRDIGSDCYLTGFYEPN
jgi:hypothetical protein